ncbi:hypothetical protein Ocin01_11014 [Orchesella cincta]|uniref:C2H2-type domain-containing protein n=1 Tax=Orchesella cincta TaxID=48709 RepID=A0A1D2MRP0_ORCCI|nr:hypothetical protein Ocin01_11014 [Orchesella cincta]
MKQKNKIRSYADCISMDRRFTYVVNGRVHLHDKESARKMDERQAYWMKNTLICSYKGCTRGFLSMKALWKHRLEHIAQESSYKDQEHGDEVEEKGVWAEIIEELSAKLSEHKEEDNCNEFEPLLEKLPETEEEDTRNEFETLSENLPKTEQEDIRNEIEVNLPEEKPPTLECMVMDNVKNELSSVPRLDESEYAMNPFKGIPELDFHGYDDKATYSTDLDVEDTETEDSALGDSVVERMDTSDDEDNPEASLEGDYAKYLEMVENQEGSVLVADVKKYFPNHRCMLCKHCDTYYFNISFLRLHYTHVHPKKNISYLCEETVTTYDLPIVMNAAGPCRRYTSNVVDRE